jgi:CheY-like chemotaxis protein
MKKILFVDDEQDITFALSIGLEDNGFVVDSFNDPLLALQCFKEKRKENNPYALALLDIKMPKMSGFELYNEIRKIDDKVKVCFITAFDIQKDEHFDSIEELVGFSRVLHVIYKGSVSISCIVPLRNRHLYPWLYAAEGMETIMIAPCLQLNVQLWHH